MKIEVVYPEVCCLFGDKANMRYLKLCLPEAEFINTPISEEPLFLTEDVDMVYFGSCSESNQERIISRLKGHEERVKTLIENGVIFLMTGNTFEVFGKYIEKPDGTMIDALGIFEYYAKRTIPKRNNSLMLAKFGEMNIVGYTSRFSNCYNIPQDIHFLDMVKGYGSHMDDKIEGVHYKNFFGTYLLGPMLIENPYFTKYLMELSGENGKMPALFDDAKKAYDVRLEEFQKDIVFFE